MFELLLLQRQNPGLKFAVSNIRHFFYFSYFTAKYTHQNKVQIKSSIRYPTKVVYFHDFCKDVFAALF